MAWSHGHHYSKVGLSVGVVVRALAPLVDSNNIMAHYCYVSNLKELQTEKV